MNKLISGKSLPSSVDLGLLVLRLVTGVSLLRKHGLEKVFNFSAMAGHFPNPIHIGVIPSLVIAMISDLVCSILIILGLGTRWAALFSFANIFVAWAFVHHFAFAGQGGDHGELVVLYLGALMTIFLAGPGRFSVDEML